MVVLVVGGTVLLVAAGGAGGGGLEGLEDAGVEGAADWDTDADEGDGKFGAGPDDETDAVA